MQKKVEISKVDENFKINNQDNKTKYLGITATPQRDVDLINMADELAKKFGYSDEDIKNNNHLAYNLDLIDAIKAGYVMNPKIVQCEYNLINDGSLERLLEKVNEITDADKRNYYFIKLFILSFQMVAPVLCISSNTTKSYLSFINSLFSDNKL